MAIKLLQWLLKDGKEKILKGGVVGTLMSNYGLEKFFLNEKINFKRSNVGDRYERNDEKIQL